MATVAACTRGERAMQGLARRYGAEVLLDEMAHLLDYTEQMTRAEFGKLADGEWTFEDFLDDDGFSEESIRIRCTITKHGDALDGGLQRQLAAGARLDQPAVLHDPVLYLCLRALHHGSGLADQHAASCER